MSGFTMNWPNSTETMAERAWRYGETSEPGEVFEGWFYALTFYADRSALLAFCDGAAAFVFRNWDLGAY